MIHLREEAADFAGGRPLVAIVNSRQSKRPCRRDPWVEGTCRAVTAYAERGAVFITSVGMNTWELAVYLVGKLGGRQVILTEPSCEPGEIISSFELDPKRTLILGPFDSGRRVVIDSPHARDELAVSLADVVVPISIRPQGFFEKTLGAASSRGRAVDTLYATTFSPATDQPHYDFKAHRFNPALAVSWDYLTHWTRSHHGPLPGETAASFYRDLLESNEYPRSALRVLQRIVREGCIRASDRFIRGGYAVVSLTAHDPITATKLMRWRRRYVYYNFEPYGIAVTREAALTHGVRPVVYGDDSVFEALIESDRPFFQKAGSKVADWTPEAEWRHRGDFLLSDLPKDQVRVFVFRPEEVNVISEAADLEVVSLMI